MPHTRARWWIVRGIKIYILNGVEAADLERAERFHPAMQEGDVYVIGTDKDGRPNEYGKYLGRNDHGYYCYGKNERNPYCFSLVAATGDQCANGKAMNLDIMLPASWVEGPKRLTTESKEAVKC